MPHWGKGYNGSQAGNFEQHTVSNQFLKQAHEVEETGDAVHAAGHTAIGIDRISTITTSFFVASRDSVSLFSLSEQEISS